jgi:transcriptional regulator with XRE-family HTH domain
VNLSPTARYISAGIEKMKLSEGITLSQMANKLNISYAQIRNLKDLKVEKPTFTTAIKFFIILRASEEKRRQLMKEDYQEMFKLEQEKRERAPVGTIDPQYNTKTADTSLAYRIYALANCDCGVSRTAVKNSWGSEGEELLNDFIKEEILQETDGLVTSFAERYRDTDREVIKRKQEHCLKFLDLNDHESWLTLITQSVNKNAQNQIRDAVKETHFKISSIVNDSKSNGNIPLFFNMNLGKLLRGNKI